MELKDILSKLGVPEDALESAEQTVAGWADQKYAPEITQAKATSESFKRHYITERLKGEKAHNPALVYKLLKPDEICLEEDGSLKGFEEQFTPLKQENAFLFKAEPTGAVVNTGVNHAESAQPDADMEQIRTLMK